MFRLLFMLILLLPAATAAQSGIEELDPSQYYDFWVGEWKLEWEEKGGSKGYGTNKIEKILDGKVLLENFEALRGQMQGYMGKSFSVYDPRAEEWRQTWVDSNGSYLEFIGRLEGEKRIFWRETTDRDGNPVMQRMVFYEIEEESFYWDWEYSDDGGESWELRWRIEYSRVQ